MTLDATRARRLIVAAAVLGGALRVAFGAIYWVDKPLTHDEHEYLALARSLASGAGFVYDAEVDAGTAQQFGRAPGYPLFLAALDAGRPVPAATPLRVKVAQSCLGAVIVWLIGLLALGAAGPRAGVAAASLAAVYPSLVWTPAYVLSETLYGVAALAAALTLQRAADAVDAVNEDAPRSALAWAILAGLLVATGALIRPALLLFLPLALAWLLLRRRATLALAMTLVVVVTIAPWTLRNLRTYGRPVLIASEGGVTFWTGNHPLARGEGDLAANPALKQADLDFRAAHPGLGAEALEPLYYRAAVDWIAAHPVDWLRLVARKAFYTVVPIGPSYALHSARYRLASVLPYLLVLPLAALGARRLWPSSRRPTALFLLAGSSVLVCVLFFPQERFRIPIVDPVMIVSAAALAGRQFS